MLKVKAYFQFCHMDRKRSLNCKDVHIVVPFAYLLSWYSKFEWAENVAVQARTKKLSGKQICCTTKWFLWKLDNLSHLYMKKLYGRFRFHCLSILREWKYVLNFSDLYVVCSYRHLCKIKCFSSSSNSWGMSSTEKFFRF